MSNILQQFITSRAERQKEVVTNTEQPVTRAEFNTLVLAVHGLIEDMDAAMSPEKLAAAMNAAFSEATKGRTPLANARRGTASHTFLAPAGEPDGDNVGNIMPPVTGKPSALRVNGGNGGRTFLAPKGD